MPHHSRVFLWAALGSLLVIGCGGSSSNRKTLDGSSDNAGNETGDGNGGTDTPLDAAPESPDTANDVSDASVTADAVADAGDADDAAGTVATLFLSHATNGAIYRYTISPGKDPVLNATFAAPGSGGMAISGAGELFASALDGSVFRFTTPLGTPTPNGKLQNLGVTDPEEMAFIDDELWIPTTDYLSCTTSAAQITRVAFDASGAGSVAGTVQAPGIITASRGVLWDGSSRTLYLSDCHSVDVIQPYHVGSDHTLTALAPASGGTINNPHGMVLTSWGELLVSNANANQILRFTVGAQGALTANGAITDNGLNFPIGLAIAPWGELIVVNQGTGSLSRFTFDAADAGHAATPNGVFQTGLNSSASSHDLGWLLLVPAPSSAAASDGGTADAADASGG